MLETKNLDRRQKRHLRIRKKLQGTAERPRLSVHKSLKHLYVQLTDDQGARCLVASPPTPRLTRTVARKHLPTLPRPRKLASRSPRRPVLRAMSRWCLTAVVIA